MAAKINPLVYLWPVKLSILLVAYNSLPYLRACLDSVNQAIQSAGFPVEVVVVDNASVDKTIETLSPDFPWVKWVANKENTGFSKACNQAFALASGEYSLFLNPDTVIPADSLKNSLNFLDKHPEIGALGVRMLDDNGRFLPESKRGIPGPQASFFKLFGFSSLFPRSRFFSAYYAGHVGEMETAPVDALSGAYLLIRSPLFKSLGGFDESFFMYAEDIDLSIRVKQAGYSCYYFSEVTIRHAKGKSTIKDQVYRDRFYGAMTIFVNKYYKDQPVKAAILKTGIKWRKLLAAWMG